MALIAPPRPLILEMASYHFVHSILDLFYRSVISPLLRRAARSGHFRPPPSEGRGGFLHVGEHGWRDRMVATART